MKVRKEVHIDDITVVSYLQQAADKKKWSLKKYMEFVLETDATRIKNRTTFASNNQQQTEKRQVR